MKQLMLLVALLVSVSLQAEDLEHSKTLDLFSAIDAGELEAVKTIINNGVSVDTQIEYAGERLTPLMLASSYGNEEIVSFLIQAGADINTANPNGNTALRKAVENGHAEIVKLLIQKGAKVNLKDASEAIPLHTAAAAGFDNIVGVLIESGSDREAETWGLTPLMMAISANKIQTIRLLINRGVQVNHVSSVSGQTALFYAINGGNTEIVQALIDSKADIDFHTKEGDTPLKTAHKNHDDVLVKLLMSAGATE